MTRPSPPPHRPGRQRGATLVITMIMVILMTLLVVSAIRISNVNLRITGNFQWQKAMELTADAAMEQAISTYSTFTSTVVQTGSSAANSTAADMDICSNGAVVAQGACSTLTNPKIGTVSAPRCSASRPAPGYSKLLGALSPMDNDWVFKSTVTDPVTGATVTTYRGVTVRMPANTCPE